MDEQALAAVGAMAGGTTPPVGRFRFVTSTQRWWWSDELFQMHGFAPGDVIPTTELLQSHKHPEDRAYAIDSIAKALRDGQPFCCRHRIIDNRQHVRTVVSIGQGLRDQSGEIAELRGFFIDVTRSLQRDLATRTHEAVQRSAQARAGIEQAKGALMAIYSIDEEEAFAILTWHSQNTNTKLRDVAETLTASLDDPDLAELHPEEKLSVILANVADSSEEQTAMRA
ncbi:MAG TPA: PAS and ANTAR domain-containing protein [Mycobacterium sp.]